MVNKGLRAPVGDRRDLGYGAAMEMRETLALLAAAVALAAFSGWRGARPPNLMKGPRMIPWRAVMVAATTLALLLLVHVVNLLGLNAGAAPPS
jgi:hypothetical protein